MSEHFNKLTPAEAERLAMLSEECAEDVRRRQTPWVCCGCGVEWCDGIDEPACKCATAYTYQREVKGSLRSKVEYLTPLKSCDFDRGMLARLAEAFERMDREPPRSLPYWPIGVAVFFGALAMAFALADPVYPSPPTGPGYEICKTKGC